MVRYSRHSRRRFSVLIRYSPDEILAVRTERGLLEEARNEVMIFDVIDVLLLERSFSAAVPHPVLILGHLIRGVFLFSHHDGTLFPCLLLTLTNP